MCKFGYNQKHNTKMKNFRNIEELIYDIIKEKSKIECTIGASHLAKLCHIIGFRTSIDEVEDVLGRMMHEEKIVCLDFRGQEVFKIA